LVVHRPDSEFERFDDGGSGKSLDVALLVTRATDAEIGISTRFVNRQTNKQTKRQRVSIVQAPPESSEPEVDEATNETLSSAAESDGDTE
jgi:hypothetical protein